MEQKTPGGSNKILVILLIAAAFVIGSLWQKNQKLETTAKVQPTAAPQVAGQQAPQQPAVTMDQIKGLFSKDYITFGDANRKVLFVEFSDPSCPYCHVAAGKNPELNAQVGDRFKLDTDGGTYIPPVREIKKLVDEGKASYVYIYRNGHGNGELAAQALYCANEKGKFWQAHDLLMSNAGYTLINEKVKNDKANTALVVDFLKSAVDSSFLTQCLESGKYADKLSRDTKVGDSMGVGGTPGFFVNTTNFAGAYSFADMKSAVTL